MSTVLFIGDRNVVINLLIERKKSYVVLYKSCKPVVTPEVVKITEQLTLSPQLTPTVGELHCF